MTMGRRARGVAGRRAADSQKKTISRCEHTGDSHRRRESNPCWRARIGDDGRAACDGETATGKQRVLGAWAGSSCLARHRGAVRERAGCGRSFAGTRPCHPMRRLCFSAPRRRPTAHDPASAVVQDSSVQPARPPTDPAGRRSAASELDLPETTTASPTRSFPTSEHPGHAPTLLSPPPTTTLAAHAAGPARALRSSAAVQPQARPNRAPTTPQFRPPRLLP